MPADHRSCRPDEDNPEWTDADFARAEKASDALPRFIGEEATLALPRRDGSARSGGLA